MNKIKLLYLTPHLSTGGMPQFVLKRIKDLQKHKDKVEIFLVEYSKFSETYTVQRDEIIDILDSDHFFTLGDSTETRRKYDIIEIIKNNGIDIVHSEEMLEGFESFNRMPIDLMNMLYSPDRTWKMVETCHNIWFDPSVDKKLKPDAYSLVSPYHIYKTFSAETSFKELHEYPYTNNSKLKSNRDFALSSLGLDPKKKHVLNVGLWTRGKNQAECVEVARILAKSNPEIFFNFVGNMAPNFEDYWGDVINNLPDNVKIWGERSDVDQFMIGCDIMMFNSTWECNPLVIREAAGYGMKILARNLPQYNGMFDKYITPINGNPDLMSEQLLSIIDSDQTYEIPSDVDFGDRLIEFYNKVIDLGMVTNEALINDYKFIQNFVNQPYFELNGTSNNKFKVEFLDAGKVSYSNELPFNSWTKLNKQYYIKWETRVYESNKLIYNNILDLSGKRVYIAFGSKSLGDTLAWMPYVEEFRKLHGCKLIVSSFLNYLFVDQYSDIEFIEPGKSVDNIYAQYNLGWYYDGSGNVDYNRVPNDFRKQPLQKTATDILGLEYNEIRPKLNLPKSAKKKKVGIGFHSTAQAKYWNNLEGWQEIVDYLISLGYECMIYSREGDGYMNNNYPTGVSVHPGGSLQEIIDDLSECEFFIGLGSGLSWLAWACELPVVLISGFSEKWAETKLDTYRVINEKVCHGCFNSEKLDAGDWNWCPLHKDTDRMFECTKKISSNDVIVEINKILYGSNDDLVTVVLSHANTEEKRLMLIESLKSISTKKILSSNYPVDDEIRSLCDHVIYDDENPILLKEEFDEYGAYFYWTRTSDNGEEERISFDYEHGYAVYKLIKNGLLESEKLGFKYSHVINYDYIIDQKTLIQNSEYIKNHDGVFYTYKNKSYTQDSYCTGFFSGKIDKLLTIFDYYKSKREYYSFNGQYKILEIITNHLAMDQKLRIKELVYEDLTECALIDKFSDDHKFTSGPNVNVGPMEFKRISDSYECDKTSKHEYHKIYPPILDPIRDDEFSLFEIGIDRGKSVNLWKDYLKKAKIYGMDIDHEWSHDRGMVFKGDQNSFDDLDRIISNIEKCRVIVDDGSHNPEHQIKTFYHLFDKLLCNGGYYVIEDIETSYWDPKSYLYGYEVGHLNIVDYFTKLNHQVNFKYNGYSNDLNIEYIKFASNCIIVKKYD